MDADLQPKLMHVYSIPIIVSGTHSEERMDRLVALGPKAIQFSSTDAATSVAEVRKQTFSLTLRAPQLSFHCRMLHRPCCSTMLELESWLEISPQSIKMPTRVYFIAHQTIWFSLYRFIEVC